MGGNIFPNKTRRYSRDEYFILEAFVVDDLNVIFNESNNSYIENLQSIKAYHSKDSFGDMDIVVCSEYLKSNWIDIIVKQFHLGHGDWSKNGNVLSFVYEQFQIDLIITPKEDYQTSLDYFSWNDCGNLCGRICHKIGVKYGHRGAELIVKDNDRQIGTILLTKDTKEIHELLDLNHDEWVVGFHTLKDMFVWVSNSKFFNKEIYLLDNRNNYARTRDNKRTTYSAFLDWCSTQEFKNNYPHADLTEKSGYNIREPYFSQMILPKFPHVSLEYIEIMLRFNDENRFKDKFNGNIIHKLTGYEGKELGMFIQYCRENIDRTNMKYMYLKHEQHTCNQMILSLQTHYQNDWNWGGIPENDAINYVRNNIVNNQESLGTDFEKVLHVNLSDLYQN